MATIVKRALRSAAGWATMSTEEKAVYDDIYHLYISSWANEIPADISPTTGTDEEWVLDCYDDFDAPTQQAYYLSIGGKTTGGNKITIRGADADGINGPSRYSGVDGVGFEKTYTNPNHAVFRANNRDIVIDGITLSYSGDNQSLEEIVRTYQHNIIIQNCLLIRKGTGPIFGVASQVNQTIIKCVGDNLRSAFRGGTHYNCIVINSDTGFSGGGIAKNCVTIQNGVDYTGISTESVTNATSESSANDTSVTVIDVSSSDFVDLDNGNFHLSEGSVLKGQGTDLSAFFTTDIDGTTIVPPWPIGVHYPADGEPPTGENGDASGVLDDVGITAVRGFATIVGQGHAEGSLANVDVTAVDGYAEHFGDGVALGSLADVEITPVDGSAISIKEANALGNLADIDITPIDGFADISDRGLASGSIADTSITPVEGSAQAVMHGRGQGNLSAITITPIDGYATIDGSSFASGGLANLLITPITGRASIPSDDGSAIGLLANVTITPVDGSAISIKTGEASGSLVDISITPILGFADIGQRANASGSLADVYITPIDGLATATIEGNAIGLLANVSVIPIKGFAVGEGDDHGAGSIHDIQADPIDGFATAGVQKVPTIRLRVELSETIELTTQLNEMIYTEVTP